MEPIFHLTMDRECLLAILDRLIIAAQTVIVTAQIDKRASFLGSVLHLARDRQGLFVVLDRFVVPLQTSIGTAKALERDRFLGPVRQDRQRLFEVFDGLVVAAQ